MSNDITKFFSGHQQAPARDKLSEALAGFSAGKNALLGKALLRFTKQGTWIFGVDNELLAPGARLVLNPASMSKGYVAWYQSKIEGEVMQPLSLGPVDPSKLPPVNSGSIPPGGKAPSGRGWEDQASIEAVTQSEIPLCMIYKTSSLGGMKVLLDLASTIVMGFAENPKRAYPVVELGADSYQHKEYGQVFTPIIEVVGWLDVNGEPVEDFAKIGNKGKSLL